MGKRVRHDHYHHKGGGKDFGNAGCGCLLILLAIPVLSVALDVLGFAINWATQNFIFIIAVVAFFVFVKFTK